VTQVRFDPAGKQLASAADDGTIKVWDYKAGTLTYDLKGHDFIVSGIQFSADGRALVSISRDKTVKLWDMQTGRFIRTVSGDRNQIVALAVSRDGRVMATGTLAQDVSLMVYPLKVRLVQKGEAGGGDGAETGTEAGQGAPAGEPEKDLSALQGGGDAEALTYKATQGEDPARVLARLQGQLNAMLKAGKYCQNAGALDTLAHQVLLLAAYDKAAYHALVITGIIQQDLKMIYLMSRIGQRALFLSAIYDYDLPQAVEGKLTFWQEVVFNPAVHRSGRKLVLEFTDCASTVTTRSMPAELVALDLPVEVLRAIASRQVRVNFQQLQGLTPEVFAQRVLYLGEQALLAARRQSKPNDPPVSIAFKDAPETQLGLLDVDLADVDTFGYPGQVPFQLRRERGPWMSYFSDADRRKRMLMPAGNYYLRVGNKVRNVFSIRDQKDKPLAAGEPR
jgi:hypothetical protein